MTTTEFLCNDVMSKQKIGMQQRKIKTVLRELREVMRKLVSTIRAYESPKRNRTRCPEGLLFTVGMPWNAPYLHWWKTDTCTP